MAEQLGLDEQRAAALAVLGTARSRIETAQGVAHLEEALQLALAELIDCPILIVHVSTPDGIEEIRRARSRGIKVFGETWEELAQDQKAGIAQASVVEMSWTSRSGQRHWRENSRWR